MRGHGDMGTWRLGDNETFQISECGMRSVEWKKIT